MLKEYMLELDDLTQEQYAYFKKYIYNGVGSREFAINPHDLIFKKAAEYHDFAYWRGGADEDRILSDSKYLEDSLKAVKQQKAYKRPFYYVAAYTYYTFLMGLGRFAFEYSEKPRETWDELKNHYEEYQAKRHPVRSTMKVLVRCNLVPDKDLS